MKIGIQGGKGSNNEQAMQELAQKKKLKNYEIVYLYETEKVIESLLDKTPNSSGINIKIFLSVQN